MGSDDKPLSIAEQVQYDKMYPEEEMIVDAFKEAQEYANEVLKKTLSGHQFLEEKDDYLNDLENAMFYIEKAMMRRKYE